MWTSRETSQVTWTSKEPKTPKKVRALEALGTSEATLVFSTSSIRSAMTSSRRKSITWETNPSCSIRALPHPWHCAWP